MNRITIQITIHFFGIELMPYEYTNIELSQLKQLTTGIQLDSYDWIDPARWNSSTARDVFIIGPGRRDRAITGCHPHESHEKRDTLVVSGGFLKWWYQTTIGFPTKNDHFGVFWWYHQLRKHPHRGMKNLSSCVGMF